MNSESPSISSSPARNVSVWVERLSNFLIITGATLWVYEQDTYLMLLKLGLIYMIVAALFRMLDEQERASDEAS